MSRYINGVYLTPQEWKEIEEATEAFPNDGEWEDAASPVLEPQSEALNSSLEIVDDDTEKAIDAVLSDGDWSDDLPNFEVLMTGSDLEDDIQPDLSSLQNANTKDPEVQEPALTPHKRQRDDAEEAEAQPPPPKRQRIKKAAPEMLLPLSKMPRDEDGPAQTPTKRQRDEAEKDEAHPPPPKRQRKKKATSETPTKRQRDATEEDEAQQPPPKRQRKKKATSGTPRKRQRDAVEEDEAQPPPPKRQRKKKATSETPTKRQQDEAEEDEAQPTPPKRQRKKKATSETPTKRQHDVAEEDEAQPPPPKRQRKKKATSGTPTKRQRDAAEEDEAQPPPPKRRCKKKAHSGTPTKRQRDEVEEDEALPPLPPKRQRSEIDEPQPGPSGLQNGSDPNDSSGLQHVSDEDEDDEVPPPVEIYDRNGNGGDKPYSIRKRNERQHKKTRAKDINYEIKFNEQWQGNNLQDLVIDLHAMFDDMLNEVKAVYNGNDLGRVVIHHRGLNNPIVIPLIALERLDADHIMQQVQRALNSNENLALDESFRVDVGVIQLPAGGAALPINRLMGKDNSIHRKTSLFEIINNDNLCLPRAIGMCWAKLNTVTRQEWLTLTAEVPGSILDKVLAVRKCSTGYYSELRKKTRSAQGKLASQQGKKRVSHILLY